MMVLADDVATNALDNVVGGIPKLLEITTTVIDYCVSNPLLAVCIAIPFVGIGIGFFQRFLHTN